MTTSIDHLTSELERLTNALGGMADRIGKRINFAQTLLSKQFHVPASVKIMGNKVHGPFELSFQRAPTASEWEIFILYYTDQLLPPDGEVEIKPRLVPLANAPLGWRAAAFPYLDQLITAYVKALDDARCTIASVLVE